MTIGRAQNSWTNDFIWRVAHVFESSAFIPCPSQSWKWEMTVLYRKPLLLRGPSFHFTFWRKGRSVSCEALCVLCFTWFMWECQWVKSHQIWWKQLFPYSRATLSYVLVLDASIACWYDVFLIYLYAGKPHHHHHHHHRGLHYRQPIEMHF